MNSKRRDKICKWKPNSNEIKQIVQEGSRDPGMAKAKEMQSPMKETNLWKLKMTPNFIIWINPSTSLL